MKTHLNSTWINEFFIYFFNLFIPVHHLLGGSVSSAKTVCYFFSYNLPSFLHAADHRCNELLLQISLPLVC